MRRGYNQDIRAEAITKRYQGREWKEIQDSIAKKFGVKPSIRQMQKWFEDYQGTTDDPTGVKYVAKAIEDAANLARPLAQAKMMADVMPLWLKLQDEHKLSFSDAGWMAFLSFFETQLGRKNFDRIVQNYLEVRDKLAEQPAIISKPISDK
jgi:hypothetical protein